MSAFDIANSLEVEIIFNGDTPSPATIFSPSTNLAEFDPGFFIIPQITFYDSGTFVFTLQDSPDDSNWTDVPAEKLNSPSGNSEITLTGALVNGATLERLGAFSIATFVRVKIVATGQTGPNAFSVLLVKLPELT